METIDIHVNNKLYENQNKLLKTRK